MKAIKHLKIPLIPAIVALVVLLVGAGAAAYFFVPGVRAAIFKPPLIVAQAPGDLGPIYTVQERTVNLADAGGAHYLKVQILLELKPDKYYWGKSDSDRKSVASTLLSDISPKEPLIQDTITTLLSSETTDALLTTAGKDQLKKELMAKLNPYFDPAHPVVKVYFPEFIMQ